MKWKKSNKHNDDKSVRCPNCGAPVKADAQDRPKKWHERTSVTLCIAAVLALIGLGFIHIITGVVSPLALPFDVVRKESFGYRETFVDAERIQSMPYTAAKIKYPLGCKALQRKGYLESGKVFETRTANHLKEDMERWQAEFAATLGKPRQSWQDRLQSLIDIAEIDPEDANSCNARGIVAAKGGRYETAIANFTRACRRNPVFVEAYFNRGLVYVTIGQLGQAISDFGKAVEIRPGFADGFVERGLIQAALCEYDQAVSDFTRAVEIDPQRVDVYFRRSLVCCAEGEYERAWKDVRRIKSSGLAVPAGYLAYLRAASGIEE